jgi:precorrin-6B methylase 2
MQVLRAGDVVIDAGAGFGVSALAFARLVGSTGTVYAFEAQRMLSQLVCSNAATNQVLASFMAAVLALSAGFYVFIAQAGNISCINKALGASKGEIIVPELDLGQEVIVAILLLLLPLLLTTMIIK